MVELDRLSRSESFSFVVTPNVDHLVMLHEHKDEDIRRRFAEAYSAAALRLCDSRILQLLAKLRGTSLDVVTGSDLTAILFERGHLNGRRVAIIGGDETMLPELRARFPEIDLVQHIPPMGVLRTPEAIEEIEAFIASASCDYALFAIGAPQSEIAARRCAEAVRSKGVGMCIGASVEFILDRKVRAPAWMQRARLEWLFRLLNEPHRLWKRYLLEGPRIALIILRHSQK
ncbi:MAG: WecB/TagA/CpsF family glycosyltransferase [Parvularcula sp.]|nr:WecB/TagA/CpsF family glycosyltransferase [Parvularcula sp.]